MVTNMGVNPEGSHLNQASQGSGQPNVGQTPKTSGLLPKVLITYQSIPEAQRTLAICRETFNNVIATLNNNEEVASYSQTQLKELAGKCELYVSELTAASEVEKVALNASVAAIKDKVQSILKPAFKITVGSVPWDATAHRPEVSTGRSLHIKPRNAQQRESDYLIHGIPLDVLCTMKDIPKNLMTPDVLIKTINRASHYLLKSRPRMHQLELYSTSITNFLRKIEKNVSAEQYPMLQQAANTLNKAITELVKSASRPHSNPLHKPPESVAEPQLLSLLFKPHDRLSGPLLHSKKIVLYSEEMLRTKTITNVLQDANDYLKKLKKASKKNPWGTTQKNESLVVLTSIKRWLKMHGSELQSAVNKDKLQELFKVGSAIKDMHRAPVVPADFFSEWDDFCTYISNLILK